MNPLLRKITGCRDQIRLKRIGNASTQGRQFLLDIRTLENEFGLEGTFSYSKSYLDYEQYFVFAREAGETLLLSVAAILVVILIITSDFVATLLVAFCVIMTDLFLAGLIFAWGLTLNPLVVLNVIVAIGTSVDYSAHIAYAYLIHDVPENKKHKYATPARIR